MTDNPLQDLMTWRGLLLAGWIALLFAAERWLPMALAPGGDGRFGWRRLARNGAFWAMTFALSPLVVLPITLAATGLSWGPVGDWRPAAWDGWWALAIDIVLLDLFLYWWHRANHELPVLWRFHEVHHLDQHLDTSSALRFHFGELLLSALARGLFVVALDIPFTSVLVFEGLVVAATVFHHSNLKLPGRLERLLAGVVITPSIHWVHHHAIRADTDSNYGTLFSHWDRLFASRSRTRRWDTMPIGVEHQRDVGVGRLLARPFRRQPDAPYGDAPDAQARGHGHAAAQPRNPDEHAGV